MCVWTVPQDIVITLQSSSACSEGWWEEETNAKVKGGSLVCKKFSLLIVKLREEVNVSELLESQHFLREDIC